MTRLSALLLLCAAAGLASCDRNEPPAAHAEEGSRPNPTACRSSPVSLVDIVPGGGKPVDVEPAIAKTFDGDPGGDRCRPPALRGLQLRRLPLQWRRGMGPALMDDQWIYGSSMQNVAASIIEGRPAGSRRPRPEVAHLRPSAALWRTRLNFPANAPTFPKTPLGKPSHSSSWARLPIKGVP